MRINTEAKLLAPLTFILVLACLTPIKSYASSCSSSVKWGFGVLMENEYECEKEVLSGQTCFYAKASNARFWYSGAHCILTSNNSVYRRSKVTHDFKVKGYFINPYKADDGVQCFSAKRTAGNRSSAYEFCDFQKKSLFDKVAVTALFSERKKFSSKLATFKGNETAEPPENNGSSLGGFIDDAFIAFTNKSYFTDSRQSYSSAKALTAKKQPMSSQFFDEIRGTRTEEYLLSRRKNKAMVGAFPLTCNYRYTSWNYSSLREAYQRAKRGCETKINDRNNTLGQNCKCRIIALNNVLFYKPEVYIGEKGQVPILARVVENGQQIEIRGEVKIADKGATKSSFTVETDAGVRACSGYFDISNKAIGSFSMDCFDGKYVGTGDFVTTGFNPKLQVANGTAEFTATNGAKMFVIFGEDAE